jgi:hypothetical protein
VTGYGAEALSGCSQEEFTQIAGWLAGPQAAGLEHAALEEQLQQRGGS